ncbi:hypothetical protein [Pseudoalteromonas sp. P1-7a]|uniref:hypothetical protein n=1 Tax=Pseudoalteromonas sp. P1-7a TaxID=1723755 RepID=UPI0006D66E97|nr:hypothetical protein [Pseudoalteromonas sp. P1-7a]KPZ58528.1 hypothetical protein AN389_02994 [Pseudoalteromonas sp. P1-7a]
MKKNLKILICIFTLVVLSGCKTTTNNKFLIHSPNYVFKEAEIEIIKHNVVSVNTEIATISTEFKYVINELDLENYEYQCLISDRLVYDKQRDIYYGGLNHSVSCEISASSDVKTVLWETKLTSYKFYPISIKDSSGNEWVYENGEKILKPQKPIIDELPSLNTYSLRILKKSRKPKTTGSLPIGGSLPKVINLKS